MALPASRGERPYCVTELLGRMGRVSPACVSSVTGSNDLLSVLIAAGVLDRVAARAVTLVAEGKLDERDLKQLIDGHALHDWFVRSSTANSFPTTHAPLPIPLNGRLGRYPIRGVLGRGRSGPVYLSTHPGLGVPVALKVSRDITALQAEASVLARITHPNVIRAWDFETIAGVGVLVLEYANGESLARSLVRGALPVGRAYRAARCAIRGLRAIHAEGLIHGDVSPANLLCITEGRTKLGDLGTAGRNARGSLPENCVEGTWPYTAPERFEGHSEPRSDVYSLGLTLYHALCGYSPVSARGFEDCRMVHHNLRLEPLHWNVSGVERRASNLIARMTAHDPDARPTARELLAEAGRAFRSNDFSSVPLTSGAVR